MIHSNKTTRCTSRGLQGAEFRAAGLGLGLPAVKTSRRFARGAHSARCAPGTYGHARTRVPLTPGALMTRSAPGSG